MTMLRQWWDRVLRRDPESRAIRRAFDETVAASPPPAVPQAIADVIAATDRACLEARREAKRTPPPRPRDRPLPSLTDYPEPEGHSR